MSVHVVEIAVGAQYRWHCQWISDRDRNGWVGRLLPGVCTLRPRSGNQANSYVTGGRVDGLGHPRRWAIALAVVRRA
jgi:hypothetical protein